MNSAIATKDDAVSRIAACGRRLQRLGILSVAIFGSFARNQADEESDIDLLVKFDETKKTFDNFMEVCFLLEDALGRRVELVTEESLSPYLKPHIMKELEYVPLSH
ncbi:MAG: nucleotidyltransferase family protein [Phycisphaerae bacterium]|nr:nucleotidyltransferase family protein [Phycisphaerae bacterium]